MIHLAATPTVTTCSALPHSSSGGILGPIAKPIADVLAAFYSIIPNYGVAILFLSVVWMIIISPLTLKTTRSMLAMQKLQPQLQKLKDQHKNDRQAFAQAQMDLFREHNVSPFGSCLPSILPLPVFFALFRVIDGLSHTSTVHSVTGLALKCSTPKYLSANTQMYKDIVKAHGAINAFGMDIAKNALSSHSSILTAVPFFLLLLIMIGTQYVQTAQMMSRNPAAANNPQMKMMKFLPIIFGVICIHFPAGVVLYYGMSNVCRIVQQSAMYRFDPKVKALVAQEVIEVEAHTTEIDEENKGKGKPGGAKGKPGPSLAKKPPSKAPPPPPAPKSRFQRLLAQANEQQKERNAAKNGTPSKNGTPIKNGTPAKNRAPSKGGTPAKNSGAAKNGTPSKNSTPAKNGTPAKNKGSGGPGRQADGRSKANNAPGPKTSSGATTNGNPVAKVSNGGSSPSSKATAANSPVVKPNNGGGNPKVGPKTNGGASNGGATNGGDQTKSNSGDKTNGGDRGSNPPSRTGATGSRTGARSNIKKRRGR